MEDAAIRQAAGEACRDRAEWQREIAENEKESTA